MKRVSIISLTFPALLFGVSGLMAMDDLDMKGGITLHKNKKDVPTHINKAKQLGRTIGAQDISLSFNQPQKGGAINIKSKNHHAALHSDEYWVANLREADLHYDGILRNGTFNLGLKTKAPPPANGAWIKDAVVSLTTPGKVKGKFNLSNLKQNWVRIAVANANNMDACELQINSLCFVNRTTGNPIMPIKRSDQHKYMVDPGGRVMLKPTPPQTIVVQSPSCSHPPQQRDDRRF